MLNFIWHQHVIPSRDKGGIEETNDGWVVKDVVVLVKLMEWY